MSIPRKALALAAACMLAVSCLAGCHVDDGGAQDAKEVFARYSARSHDNFHVDGSFKATLASGDLAVDVPFDFSLDVTGQSSHGRYSVIAPFTNEAVTEAYSVVEGGRLSSYSRTTANPDKSDVDPAEGWTLAVTDAATDPISLELDADIFDGAEFAREPDGYNVTVNGADLVDYLQRVERDPDGTSLADFQRIAGDYRDLLGSIEVVFHFDEECDLISVAVPKATASIGKDGQVVDVTVNGYLEFSGIGTTPNVVVPAEVAKTAEGDGARADMASSIDASSR